ncbi:hypothetical protein CH063_11206, partial [Colletotrichum higginsianum]
MFYTNDLSSFCVKACTELSPPIGATTVVCHGREVWRDPYRVIQSKRPPNLPDSDVGHEIICLVKAEP